MAANHETEWTQIRRLLESEGFQREPAAEIVHNNYLGPDAELWFKQFPHLSSFHCLLEFYASPMCQQVFVEEVKPIHPTNLRPLASPDYWVFDATLCGLSPSFGYPIFSSPEKEVRLEPCSLDGLKEQIARKTALSQKGRPRFFGLIKSARRMLTP